MFNQSFFLPVLFCLAAFTSQAGEKPGYPVSDIPDSLRKNANVVQRMEDIRFEILGVGKAKEYRKYVMTVLNENGNKYAQLTEEYDKFHSIESIEGTLYDASGKKIRSLKRSDIQDYSGTGSNLMADDRIKYHSFYYKVYPYTVEYEVEIKYSFTLFYPRWLPQQDEYFSVQQSKMTIVCPADQKFRYKTFHYPAEPLVQKDKSSTLYTWQVDNLPAIEEEFAAPRWSEITPAVITGPEEFEVEGFRGNMKTWQEFGKFIYTLNHGRDILPDAVKQKVHALVDGVTDTREKIRILYEYMQQNTHYISVQLGIGGWQTFDAKYVAEKKYGDCKALSNYMYSLLKEAGIRACYVLAKAGNNDHYFIPDFPSSQFNHAIVCVPLQKDTCWLECTSQSLPAGYLSGFTSDRYVLAIDEDGGKLVRTPKYRITDNVELRKIDAAIDGEGNLSAKINTRYRAQQQDQLEMEIAAFSKDKLMDRLKSALDLPTYDVRNFNFKAEKGIIPAISEDLDLVAPGYAQVTGKRLFINPNIMTRSQTKLKYNDERKMDLEFYYEYNDVDTVEIKIPEGYQTESVPQDWNVSSQFGKYKASVKVLPDRIIYYRNNERYSGRFPAAEFPALVKFYEQLYKADHTRIVLVKK